MSFEEFGIVSKSNIRTTYASNLQNMRTQYPDAHFEIVMRFPSSVGLHVPPSILSPSIDLLERRKKREISWIEFEDKFEKEMFSSPDKIHLLKKLKKISENKLVFLVCSEKKSSHCHRSLLKKYIDRL